MNGAETTLDSAVGRQPRPPAGIVDALRRPASRISLLVIVAGFLTLISGTTQTTFGQSNEKRCLAMELYVQRGEANSDQVESWIRTYTQETAGYRLRVYELADEAAVKRHQQICSHFKVANDSVPLVYGCNQIIVKPTSEFGLIAELKDIFRLKVYTRSGCPHCSDAKRELPALTRKSPGLIVEYADVVQDRSELSELQSIAKRLKVPVANVPACYFCNEMTIGWTSGGSQGQRIEATLKKWSFPCTQEDTSDSMSAITPDPLTVPTGPQELSVDGLRRLQLNAVQNVQFDSRTRSVGKRTIPTGNSAGDRSNVQRASRVLVPGDDRNPRTALVQTALLPSRNTDSIALGLEPRRVDDAALRKHRNRGSPGFFSAKSSRVVDAVRTPTLIASSTAFDVAANGEGEPTRTPSETLPADPREEQRETKPTNELPIGDEAPLPIGDKASTGELLPLGDHSDTELEISSSSSPNDLDRPKLVAVPFFGQINVSDLGFPAFTIVIGLIDGFNPCAMWVLLFLLSILVNLRSRAKILAVAGTFVIISGLFYFACMAAWMNALMLVPFRRGAEIGLGVLAVVIGGVHVKDFFAKGKGISFSIPESAKPGIYGRVRQIVNAKSLVGAVLGASVLAITGNTIALTCTSGMPAMYVTALTSREYSTWGYYGYLGLYNLAYMFDDSLMVAAVVLTLGRHKLQEREGRWLKLISGTVILLFGLVMIFVPQWLQF